MKVMNNNNKLKQTNKKKKPQGKADKAASDADFERIPLSSSH
jgi:hypothetical protein